MRKAKAGLDTWVVFQMPVKNCPVGRRAVCEQTEWVAMDSAKPGVYTVIQAGMTNEGEAERLARGMSGVTVRRKPVRAMVSCRAEVPTMVAGVAAAA